MYTLWELLIEWGKEESPVESRRCGYLFFELGGLGSRDNASGSQKRTNEMD